METKGREFKGLAAGSSYNKWAKLFGFTENFYRKGAGDKEYLKPVRILDLACGSGSLTYAMAEKLAKGSEIYGIDISDDQLRYASRYAATYPCEITFKNCSIDELAFPDNYFDIVMTSMALHETPPKVRRKAICETKRVLKQKGEFILVDWSKPKFGLWGIVWFPLVFFKKEAYKTDNWNNTYRDICEAIGLILTEDYYINTIARRQVFVKEV